MFPREAAGVPLRSLCCLSFFFFGKNAAVAQQEGSTPLPVLPVALGYVRLTPSSPKVRHLRVDPRERLKRR